MRFLAAACSLLLVSGCGSIPPAAGPERSLFPPIVLSLDEVSVERSGMPSTSTSSAETAKEVFWLSITALLTFGAPLLDLPQVVERSRAAAGETQRCIDSWKVVSGPDSWLKSSELREYVLDTIRVEATRGVGSRETSVRVDVVSPVEVRSKRTKLIEEAGARLSAADVIFVDVRLGVQPLSTGCTGEFRAKANLRLERTDPVRGADAKEASPYASSVEGTEGVDVQRWAAEPDSGRRVLRQALAKLARAIVGAYPWPAPIQQQPAPSAPDGIAP